MMTDCFLLIVAVLGINKYTLGHVNRHLYDDVGTVKTLCLSVRHGDCNHAKDTPTMNECVFFCLDVQVAHNNGGVGAGGVNSPCLFCPIRLVIKSF